MSAPWDDRRVARGMKAQLESRRERIAAGEKALGWKVGFDIVRHVAGVLAAFGETLRAGEIIITGSIMPPLFVESGEEVVFKLEPVGAVSVRFTAQTRA